MPFWPTLARQHPRLRRSPRLARDRAANPVQQPAIRSFAPARTPKLRPKSTVPTGSDQLYPHSRRRQIPIAPAAPSVLHPPRFRALALFRRRPSERVDGLVMPASENLHTSGPEQPQQFGPAEPPPTPPPEGDLGHRRPPAGSVMLTAPMLGKHMRRRERSLPPRHLGRGLAAGGWGAVA
jgi:hypothetical protein